MRVAEDPNKVAGTLTIDPTKETLTFISDNGQIKHDFSFDKIAYIKRRAIRLRFRYDNRKYIFQFGVMPPARLILATLNMYSIKLAQETWGKTIPSSDILIFCQKLKLNGFYVKENYEGPMKSPTYMGYSIFLAVFSLLVFMASLSEGRNILVTFIPAFICTLLFFHAKHRYRKQMNTRLNVWYENLQQKPVSIESKSHHEQQTPKSKSSIYLPWAGKRLMIIGIIASLIVFVPLLLLGVFYSISPVCLIYIFIGWRLSNPNMSVQKANKYIVIFGLLIVVDLLLQLASFLYFGAYAVILAGFDIALLYPFVKVRAYMYDEGYLSTPAIWGRLKNK